MKKIISIAICIVLYFGVGVSSCFAINWMQSERTFDVRAMTWLSAHRSEGMNVAAEVLNETTVAFSFAIPCVMGVVGMSVGDKQLCYDALYVGISTVLTGGITYAMKYSFRRNRPYETYPQLLPLEHMRSPSFPSGHSGVAFSTATALTMIYPKWYIGVPVFLWATAVSFSRVYSGVHYPSDVLAGAVIGTGCAVAAYYINKAVCKTAAKKKKASYYCF